MSSINRQTCFYGSFQALPMNKNPPFSVLPFSQARRRSFETHAATMKQRNKLSRSWTPCATISATRLKSCAPKLSRSLSLSPPKNNKTVGITGFARSAGPPPPTKISCDTVGAAPRCLTAASAVPKSTRWSTSSCVRAHTRHTAKDLHTMKRGEVGNKTTTK